MTKEDDIFQELSFIKTTDCTETGLVLFIIYSDSMEILYKDMDINTIEDFIKKARENKDVKLLLPIKQFNDNFFNIFKIENGIFSVRAYEGEKYWIDTWESPIEIQLPFLEIICKAIKECKEDTKDLPSKTYFDDGEL